MIGASLSPVSSRNRRRQLDAVEPRHVDVGDEQLRLVLLHELERAEPSCATITMYSSESRRAIISASRMSSSASTIVPFGLPGGVNRSPFETAGSELASSRSRSFVATCVVESRITSERGRITRSSLPPPDARVRVDRAAVRLDELLREGEAEAGAGLPPLLAGGLSKRPNNRLASSSPIPGPVSSTESRIPVVSSASSISTRPPRRRVLHGVRHQVRRDALDRDRIDVREQHLGRPHLELELRRLGGGPPGRHELPHERDQVRRLRVRLQLAFLARGEQQQLVDQAHQLARGIGHRRRGRPSSARRARRRRATRCPIRRA